MSEATAEVQEQTVEGQTNETETSVSPEELVARMEQLERTNARLLEESKSYKSKYSSLKGEISEQEKSKLVEQENWKELLEREKNEKHEYESRFKDLKRTTLKQSVDNQVLRYAGSEAYDIGDIVNSLDNNALEIDEESLMVKGIEQEVARLKKDKPYLFKSSKPAQMASGRPALEKERTLNQLNSGEKELLYKKAITDFIKK